MSVDDIVKLVDVITELIKVLIYPGILLFILIRFGRNFGELLSSLGELSLEGAGFKASLKRAKAQASASLAAAIASRATGDTTRESAAKEAKSTTDIVDKVVTPNLIRRAGRSTVLWVDDNPNNNIYERQALEAIGVHFVLATSTDDALKQIAKQHFDAIISDMGRSSDSQAGYTLLNQLRSCGNQTPYIIYSTSREPEHVKQARKHGAIGCTNNANELFQMVLSTLNYKA